MVHLLYVAAIAPRLRGIETMPVGNQVNGLIAYVCSVYPAFEGIETRLVGVLAVRLRRRAAAIAPRLRIETSV